LEIIIIFAESPCKKIRNYAFDILKIFLMNPEKIEIIKRILFQNKILLITLCQNGINKSKDDQYCKQLNTLIIKIKNDTI